MLLALNSLILTTFSLDQRFPSVGSYMKGVREDIVLMVKFVLNIETLPYTKCDFDELSEQSFSGMHSKVRE